MKKLALLSFVLFFQLYAQSAGESGLSFLKIGVGARNLALADNGTTQSNDATAIFYNPANIGLTNNSEIFFMHNSWIQDVSVEALAVKFSLFGLPLNIGLNSSNIGNIEIRTNPGEKDGSFNAHYFSSSIGTAFSPIDNLYCGAAYKYLYENLFSDEATGYAFDFGATYLNVIPNLSASAVLKNLGSMSQLRTEKTKLPTEFRLGAAYQLPEFVNLVKTFSSVEYQKYTSLNDSHINLGIEAVYNSSLALRIGYMTAYESKGFTAGLGIKWNLLDIDYAYTPFKYSLGSAQSISIKAAL